MAVQKGIDKWKTKRWFTVYAPKIFDEQKICEIPGEDEKAVQGRNIKISLDSLTHKPQHSVSNVIMRIESVNGDSAHTKLVMIEEVYSYIRSLVRRYRSVSSVVVPVKSSGGDSFVIKAMAITKERTAASRLKAIRKLVEERIKEMSAENSSDWIVKSVIDGTMQADIYERANKIAQIGKIEIRKIESA
jgi:small subunit ribosomal protein S3Ae